MRKVKIFVDTSEIELEKEVNRFLETRIKIVDLKYAIASNKPYNFYSVLIHYYEI